MQPEKKSQISSKGAGESPTADFSKKKKRNIKTTCNAEGKNNQSRIIHPLQYPSRLKLNAHFQMKT